jgi:hypothetical protein
MKYQIRGKYVYIYPIPKKDIRDGLCVLYKGEKNDESYNFATCDISKGQHEYEMSDSFVVVTKIFLRNSLRGIIVRLFYKLLNKLK